MKTLAERFWAKVDTTGECWLWTACLDDSGYGLIGVGRRKLGKANRVSWELHFGPIPPGMCVLHRCDEPACVRPAHLFLGTHAENMADMVRKGRSADQAGERNGNAKLTALDVEGIRLGLAMGTPQRSLARMYGVGKTAIGDIASGKRWRNGRPQ